MISKILVFGLIALVSLQTVLAEEEEEKKDYCWDYEGEYLQIKEELEQCGFQYRENMTDDEFAKEYIAAFDCVMEKKGITHKEEIIIEKLKEYMNPFMLKNNEKIFEAIDKCSQSQDRYNTKKFDKCFEEKYGMLCPSDMEKKKKKR